jgi:hypothetical protein
MVDQNQSKNQKQNKHQSRPMFISLRKYNELKDCLKSLHNESTSLKNIIGNLRSNSSNGSELLKETVNRLENIEEKVVQVNSTIKI